MSVAERLDTLQQRHPLMGFPIAVLYKFIDDQGVYLAALIVSKQCIQLASRDLPVDQALDRQYSPEDWPRLRREAEQWVKQDAQRPP